MAYIYSKNGTADIDAAGPTDGMLDVKGVICLEPTGITADTSYPGNLVITKPQASGQYINLVRAGAWPWSIGTVYDNSNFAIGTGMGTDSNFTSPNFVLSTSGNIGVGVNNPSFLIETKGPTIPCTGTASQIGYTITGDIGTVFTLEMQGCVIVFAHGFTTHITTFNDSNHLTVSDSATNASDTFTIYKPGFHVTSAGGIEVLEDIKVNSWNIKGAGTETACWDHSGNSTTGYTVILNNDNDFVGIGTSVPTSKLHIQCNSGALGLRLALAPASTGGQQTGENKYSPALVFDSLNYSGVTKMFWMRQEGSNWAFKVSDPNYNSLAIVMGVTSNGNVGIGTVSPTAKLTLSGGDFFIDNNGEDRYLLVTQKLGTNYGLYFDYEQGSITHWTQTQPRLTVAENGNVGIGTTNPTAKLTLSGGDFFIDNNGEDRYLLLTKKSNDNYGLYFDYSEGSLTHWTKTQPRMTVTEDGNVGIATVSPVAKLHVQASDGSGYQSDIASGTILLVDGTGSSDAARLSIVNADGVSVLNFGGTSGSDVGSIQYDDSIGCLAFKTNGVENLMVINAYGNVGINKTNPISRLHVGGKITADNGTSSASLNIPVVTSTPVSGATGDIWLYKNGSTYKLFAKFDGTTIKSVTFS